MEKTRVLNIDALCITKEELLKGLDRNLAGTPDAGNGILITPNLDHLVKLQKDREFYDCYCEAEWVVCDSRILQKCSRLLKPSFPEAIPGSSFFHDFYLYHREDPNCKIFLLGSPTQAIADLAMQRINERAGRAIVVGAHSPSFGFEKKEDECRELVRIINESGANVVLVGVGAPKQEKWMSHWRKEMPGVKVWMGLGATIEFEAGTLNRAPEWVQRISMEWLYRALKDPKRLLRRYFVDDMQFFVYLIRQVLGIYRNPFA